MKLINGEDIRRGFHRFDLIERGKLRKISSTHISERVVQRSGNDNALVPVLTRTTIQDNMACIKGRGTHKAIYRVAELLRKHYRKTGSNKGTVVLVDFSNFFGNMDHEYIRKEILEKNFTSEEMVNFIMLFIDAFGSVGCELGSQTSQTVGTIYPNKADHYAKEVLGIHAYVRYMDDTFMAFETEEEADHAMEELFRIYESMGIVVNKKKTRKIQLQNGFTYLKTRFKLTESGKVIMRPCRDSITRERRKLKKLKKKLDEGKITFEEVRRQYQSWKGYMRHKTAWRTVKNMDQLFDELFIKNWKGEEKKTNESQI